MTTWLTQEAYDRLKAEYDRLSGPGRTEIAKKIEAAREEGDLKENGGYHAAKEEQGKMEARIRQLRQLLEEASVGERPAADAGVVAPGHDRHRRPSAATRCASCSAAARSPPTRTSTSTARRARSARRSTVTASVRR